MKVRQRLWWVLGGVFLLFCVGFVVATYHFGWTATGFLNKSLWDWLQLLIVPLVLAVVALVFQLANSRTERQIAKERYEQDQKIALDKQREDLLQTYLDRMSELLLEKQLHSPAPPSEIRNVTRDEVRNVTRVRTITILFQLDARRIGYVFAFLREAGLMSTTSESIVSLKQANLNKINFSQAVITKVDLREANLSGADLTVAYLSNASLGGAYLSNAILRGADLTEAYLSRADLSEASLSEADLGGADLSEANLGGANLGGANLSEANLSGANLGGANLSGVDLTYANLSKAILNSASLGGAYLYGVNLGGAVVTEEQLKKAKSLKGATMPDGSKHP